ncbi:54S ribosomal protein L12, mitochondrial [Microbotryomycetes sp. JL201]|nr:54S ribosomal protein L12, mitochondrial [Microbotryomycetes sp. JL201]
MALAHFTLRHATSAARAATRPAVRCLSSSAARRASAAAADTTPAAAAPTAPPAAATASPKIQQIVDQISTLTLLEAADLVEALKSKLNIADIALPAAGAVAAAPAAAADGAAAPAAEEKPKEKTVFNVTLQKIDAAQKAKAIREVKALMPGMNLVEAKKFVESLPKVVKENATKEEAEKLKELFKGIGAETSLD